MKHLYLTFIFLLGGVCGVMAQSDHSVAKDTQKNQVLLTLTNGEKKFYNTEDLQKIKFDNQIVKVIHKAGAEDDFNNLVQDIDFIKKEGAATPTKADLIGTWTATEMSYTFTENEVTIIQYGEQYYKGPYTYENGVLTYQTAEDIENNTKTTANVKLLYDNTVLVLKFAVTDPYELESGIVERAELYFKDGKTPVTPKEDIQGKWFWYYGNEKETRGGIKIDGDNIEFIITAWSLRFVGTYTYNGGILKIEAKEIYSGRSQTGEGFGPGGLNPETLECDNWFKLTPEVIEEGGYAYEDLLTFPFISDGKVAYSSFAGLPAIYYKQ